MLRDGRRRMGLFEIWFRSTSLIHRHSRPAMLSTTFNSRFASYPSSSPCSRHLTPVMFFWFGAELAKNGFLSRRRTKGGFIFHGGALNPTLKMMVADDRSEEHRDSRPFAVHDMLSRSSPFSRSVFYSSRLPLFVVVGNERRCSPLVRGGAGEGRVRIAVEETLIGFSLPIDFPCLEWVLIFP